MSNNFIKYWRAPPQAGFQVSDEMPVTADIETISHHQYKICSLAIVLPRGIVTPRILIPFQPQRPIPVILHVL